MEYRSSEQYRVLYRNNLVEKLKKLIEEREQNFDELEMMKVFKDLIEVENMSICYQTKRCNEELQQEHERLEGLIEDRRYYNCAIKRKYEEIRVLEERMIPEKVKGSAITYTKVP